MAAHRLLQDVELSDASPIHCTNPIAFTAEHNEEEKVDLHPRVTPVVLNHLAITA